MVLLLLFVYGINQEVIKRNRVRGRIHLEANLVNILLSLEGSYRYHHRNYLQIFRQIYNKNRLLYRGIPSLNKHHHLLYS